MEKDMGYKGRTEKEKGTEGKTKWRKQEKWDWYLGTSSSPPIPYPINFTLNPSIVHVRNVCTVQVQILLKLYAFCTPKLK